MSNLTSYILALLCLWLAIAAMRDDVKVVEDKPAPVEQYSNKYTTGLRIEDTVEGSGDIAISDCQTFNNFTSCTNMAGCTWGDNGYCSGSYK